MFLLLKTEACTLPIIQKDSNFQNNETGNLNDTPDYSRILNIYQRLINARGDFRYLVPKLYLKQEESHVASIDYNKSEIVLEKKAYDVCSKFGDAAIAFLLAHELTHYYEKHAYGKIFFASEIVDLNVSKNINSVQNQVLNETQADYLGGFLAYSAGFGLFEKGDSLIANLYQSYGLGENLDGYPSKSDRMVLSKRIAEKVKTLVDVFEMANLLSAIGKHHEAYLYYKYILNQYQSREIYNNLGVSAVMDAMTYFNKDSLKFSYVNEMDVQFRGSRDLANRKDSILKQAIFHFDAAISLDPDYSIAYLNKANAYALLNNLSKAKFYLEEEALPIVLKTKTNSKTLSDIHVLQGIIAAREGNNSLATTFFNKAIENNNQLGQINLDVLNNVPHEMVNVVRIPTFDDTISNMSLKAFTQKIKMLRQSVS
ncbi:MAG: hypothetical protein IPL95_08325 [Saprospiraceae bacterium]|nr:hypothetical protein [Saprospiraceae bacterium]